MYNNVEKMKKCSKIYESGLCYEEYLNSQGFKTVTIVCCPAIGQHAGLTLSRLSEGMVTSSKGALSKQQSLPGTSVIFVWLSSLSSFTYGCELMYRSGPVDFQTGWILSIFYFPFQTRFPQFSLMKQEVQAKQRLTRDLVYSGHGSM